MKLLQTEINIVPGRPAQKQPLPEGMVGQGAAVVRLTNNTPQENAYTVRIRCDNPYWQETWYTVTTLPPTGAPENAPPPGKPDQSGPNQRYVTLFITRGGTRDVMILFNVPEKSDSRAGIYNLTIQIETRVVGQATGLRRKERFAELSAVAIIRPFVKWSSEIVPETRKVGFFRRGSDFEATITNEGNDWLYCELRIPRPVDVLVQTQTVRLAIPPAEPGQDRVTRSVPIKGISKKRPFRGEKVPLPLPVTVARLEAPSVAPLPEDALYSPSSANCHAAVVEADTQDLRLPQNEKALVYCPLIPATLGGCFGAIAQNGKGLIMFVIGLIVAMNLGVFMFEQLFRNNIEANPFRGTVAPGATLTIGGRWLIGSRVYIRDAAGPKDAWEELKTKKAPENEGMRNYFAALIQDLKPSGVQLIAVDIPESYDTKKISVLLQRGGVFPFLGPLLPRYECRSKVQVGNPPKAQEPPKKAYAMVSPTVAPGKPFAISGSGFGGSGDVMLGAEKASVKLWSSSRILAVPPGGVPFNEPIPVNVIPSNRDPIAAGVIKVVDPATAQAGAPGGGGAAPPPAGGGASTTTPGAGGSTPPAAGGGQTTRPPAITRRPPTLPPVRTAGGASAAYTALLSGDSSAAASAAGTALRANPNDALALAVRGYTLVQDEKLTEADGVIRQALRATSGRSGRARAVALTAAGGLSELRGDATSAERQYGAAIEADRTCVLAYYIFAYYLHDNNRRTEAIGQARAALQANPREARASRKFMDLAGRLGVR